MAMRAKIGDGKDLFFGTRRYRVEGVWDGVLQYGLLCWFWDNHLMENSSVVTSISLGNQYLPFEQYFVRHWNTR